MSEEEKYWGCTPVVTAHMEARMKASREYAKMVSNDDETPEQRADRARDFESGAIWEEGYSKQFGWHPASELPPVNENLISELVICWCVDSTFHTLEPKLGRVWRGEWGAKDVKWWCYPPKEE